MRVNHDTMQKDAHLFSGVYLRVNNSRSVEGILIKFDTGRFY
jgi:hypothetical protein